MSNWPFYLFLVIVGAALLLAGFDLGVMSAPVCR